MRLWFIGVLALVSAVVVAQAPPERPGLEAVAEEAYLFAYPMIEFYRTFYQGAIDRTSSSYQAPLNELFHARSLVAPSFRLVARPNNDTLYSRVRLDLREGAAVISLPPIGDRRYWSLQLVDLYTHNVAIFSPRNQPSTGTRYLVAAPSWKGRPPAGITATVRSEGKFVYALIRVEVRGEDDLGAARTVQDHISLSWLDEAGRRSQAPPLKTDGFPRFDRVDAESGGFVRYLNFLLGRVEVHPSEVALVESFSPLGVGPGRPFDVARLDPTTRTALDRGAKAALGKIRASLMSNPRRGTWTVSASNYGNRQRLQGRYLVRSLAAMRAPFGLDAEEAVYMTGNEDADGAPLDARDRSYVVRFGADALPPSEAFWSLTMYDEGGFLVANERGRYSIGDRTAGLLRGSDGSVTIVMSARPPSPSQDVNWLPAPAGRFSLSLRMYVPRPLVADYVPPPIEKVK